MPHPILGDQRRVSRVYKYIARGYDRFRPLFTGFESTRDQYFSELHLEDDDRILDVGCGTGESTRRVVGANRSVYGIDLSPAQLQVATTKPDLTDASFSLGDATRLPFHSDSFDVVMSIGSLPYVPDVDAALAEAHRVTAEEGRLFIVGPKYPKNRFSQRLADALLHFVEPAAFVEHCRSAGWRDISTTTIHMDWLGRDAVVVTARA